MTFVRYRSPAGRVGFAATDVDSERPSVTEPLLSRYLQPLLAGRRAECFNLIRLAVAEGRQAESIMREVVWPAMAQVDRLFRDDRINIAVECMACRINRTVADQLQAHLPTAAANGKRV